MRINLTKITGLIGETQSGKTVLLDRLFMNSKGRNLFIDIEDADSVAAGPAQVCHLSNGRLANGGDDRRRQDHRSRYKG